MPHTVIKSVTWVGDADGGATELPYAAHTLFSSNWLYVTHLTFETHLPNQTFSPCLPLLAMCWQQCLFVLMAIVVKLHNPCSSIEACYGQDQATSKSVDTCGQDHLCVACVYTCTLSCQLIIRSLRLLSTCLTCVLPSSWFKVNLSGRVVKSTQPEEGSAIQHYCITKTGFCSCQPT